MQTKFKNEFTLWISKQNHAIELLALAQQLWFNKSLELVIFRKTIIDSSPSEILNHHLYARQIVKNDVTVDKTLAITKEIAKLDLPPTVIDIGKLTFEWESEETNFSSKADFVKTKLANLIGKDKSFLKPKDVVLYGFGRVGRLAARILFARAGRGDQLLLKAIVVRETKNPDDILKRAELLRSDSVHGPFKGTITVDNELKAMKVNGHIVQIIHSSAPDDVDYTAFGIKDALLIDNTGVYRDREGLSKHLKSNGISQVILTAPGKGDIPNIVYGVNQTVHKPDEKIFSAASCTTNAIAPVLKVVNDYYTIDHGHIETVHSYTNDQNLLDNYHKKYRRGRSAALNMVITETGAAKAVAKVIPELAEKFTGNAVRVPTPNVSLAILHLRLKKETSIEELNGILRAESLSGPMCEQIEYAVSFELVSSDIIGNTHACVVDSAATLIDANKRNVVLYVWYDNEFGYTRQVVRLAGYMSKNLRLTYY